MVCECVEKKKKKVTRKYERKPERYMGKQDEKQLKKRKGKDEIEHKRLLLHQVRLAFFCSSKVSI